MAAPAIDTQSGFKDALNKGTLNIGDDIKGTLGNIGELDKSLSKLSSTWSSNISGAAKLGASVGALGSIAVNATFGIANISSAFSKLQGAKSIIDGATNSVKTLAGVSKSINFSEAILGTKEFAANIKILEETTDSVFNRISTASQIIFDNSAYQKWSIGAVAAYSKVESAAFKLATITTSSEESALSAVGARIKALRELQRETNFATNSTQTLNAQYDIASAGFGSSQGQKSVGKASVNLSEVGFGNLEGTNQGIVKILAANKNLGDSFRDADKRAAQLFATTKVGILTLDQLNSEAAELASTGASAGVSFEEMATSLALVTTQGISANEGSTAIRTLVSEIVNNIPKAQEALGTLRDEAGKPIQFGFGALKEEGLIKLIERVGKATGGSRDALNKIFSSSEAVKAANALLQSGGENRKNFRSAIEEAGSAEGQDKLAQSAKERGQTLEGAFRSSFNKSQAAVEDFGSGVGEEVKKNLQDTNTLLGVLATKSSSSFGTFAGQLDGVANKFQAVSGFIGSVFSVVAPLAFFSFLFKNLGRLGETIKKALKLDDGDVKFETLGQKIEAAIVRIAKIVVSKVKGIVAQVNEEIAKVGDDTTKVVADKINPPTPTPASEVIATNRRNPDSLVERSPILRTARNIGSGIKDIGAGTIDIFRGNNDILNKAGAGLDKIGKATAPVRNVIGGAAKELGSFALSTGLVGGGIALATTAIAGGITAFNAYSNAASIPEVKELADDLKELKGVAGLDEFVRSITDTRAQLKGMSEEAKALNTVITNLGQSFNILNGNAAKNDVFQKTADTAISKISDSINANDALAKSGQFKAITDSEKNSQQKIKLGLVLNEEDIQAVKSAFQRQQDELQARAKIAKDKAEKERSLGGVGSTERAQEFEDQAKVFEKEAEVKGKLLDTEQKRILLASQLKKLQSFDSAVPISISTSVAFNSSSKAQFNQLKETLDTVFTVDKIDVSKVDIQEFSKILPKLQGVLSNITVQADIDPKGAIEGLQRLTKDVRVMQFVASDPTAQKALDEAFKVATDKILGYNNAVTNSYTKLFTTLSNAGAIGGEAVGQSTKKSLQNIQANIDALRTSLDAPNVSAQDYAERLSKIADLSAEAFNIKNAGQINEELGKRKQLLTFNQGLLEVQKNIVSLFSQESKFGSFSVSLAQAKLAAAEKELSVKQESLAISAREEEITKKNILEAAQTEVGNRAKLLQQVLKSGNISESDAQSQFGVNQKIDLADRKAVSSFVSQKDKEISGFQANLDASQAFSNNGKIKITKEQADKLRQDLLQEQLNKTSQVTGLGDAFETRGQAEARAKTQAEKQFNNIVNSQDGNTFIDSNALRQSPNQSEAAFNVYKEALDKVKEEEKNLQKSIDDTKKARDSATGASDQLKERAGNIDIESAKKVVKQAEEDLKFTVVANRLKQEIGALSETIARNEAAIDASFAPQQRLVDISKGVGDAFSSLGSTASSLFSASSLGSAFSNIGSKLADRTGQVLLDANKEISKVTARLNTVVATRDRVASANADAKKQGRTDPDLQKAEKDLNKQVKTAQLEAQRDLQYIKQRTVLEGVNASLERFGVIAKEGADRLDKVANLANNRLDLEGRREASTVQNNQATRGFTGSVLGLFGQNNPAAAALAGRNEILGAIDKTKADKNEAGRAGEKELNTLQVQEQQLRTEETMLVNALTQTQLLGKLVEKIDPSSGIQVGDISSVNQVIGNIPKNIADAQAQTRGALNLNQETQQFVRQDTFDKIRNIDLAGQSQILDIAKSNPTAGLGSIDLVSKALSSGFGLSAQRPIQGIADRNAFGDSFNETQRQLQGIGNSTRDTLKQQAQEYQSFLQKDAKKITNDFAAASPNKPATSGSTSGQQNLSVIVNNSITLDGVKTSFGGDSLNKVGAALGRSGDIIEKSLNNFGKAFLDLSKTAFGV